MPTVRPLTLNRSDSNVEEHSLIEVDIKAEKKKYDALQKQKSAYDEDDDQGGQGQGQSVNCQTQ